MKKIVIFLLTAVLVLASCEKDDNIKSSIPSLPVKNSLLIVNEGNYYSQINSSLSVLDFSKNEMYNNVFQSINGKVLGGTPNDIEFAEGKYFIPVTDENLVWVLDESLRILKQIDKIKSPRHVAVMNGVVYVSSYDGNVYSIDAKTLDVKESEKIGECLEDITCLNGNVYVCNAYTPGENYNYTYHTNVVKLDAKLNKIKDITVAANPTQIENDGTNVYAMSMGNYDDVNNQIQKISADDNVEKLCDGTYFALSGNKLYYIFTTPDEFWEQKTDYYVLDLSTNTSQTFIDGKDIKYPCFISANPTTGEVYISSLRLSEYGYGDYNNPGYIVRYNAKGEKTGRYDVGVSPKAMFIVK